MTRRSAAAAPRGALLPHTLDARPDSPGRGRGAAPLGLAPSPARRPRASPSRPAAIAQLATSAGLDPELTQFGREFKLGGYTLRMHASVPISAMVVASWTHTAKDQVPPPEHLNQNNNLVLDQASLFVAGGIGEHFGGFAQLVTYDGVGRAWSWDNIDLRAVTSARCSDRI